MVIPSRHIQACPVSSNSINLKILKVFELTIRCFPNESLKTSLVLLTILIRNDMPFAIKYGRDLTKKLFGVAMQSGNFKSCLTGISTFRCRPQKI